MAPTLVRVEERGQIDGEDLWSHEGHILKVARLQSEFCTKDFFRATNFLSKNAPKFSPKFSSLCSVGQKKIPGKFPPNFPLNFPNFPAKNKKKFTDKLLQVRRENISSFFSYIQTRLMCSIWASIFTAGPLTMALVYVKNRWFCHNELLGEDFRPVWTSEGREWGVGSVVVEFGVFGAPRFSVQRSQNTRFKGFGDLWTENRGAPKTQIQPRRIQPPILGPPPSPKKAVQRGGGVVCHILGPCTIFFVEIPWFSGTWMPYAYGRPLYNIFSGACVSWIWGVGGGQSCFQCSPHVGFAKPKECEKGQAEGAGKNRIPNQNFLRLALIDPLPSSFGCSLLLHAGRAYWISEFGFSWLSNLHWHAIYCNSCSSSTTMQATGPVGREECTRKVISAGNLLCALRRRHTATLVQMTSSPTQGGSLSALAMRSGWLICSLCLSLFFVCFSLSTYIYIWPPTHLRPPKMPKISLFPHNLVKNAPKDV